MSSDSDSLSLEILEPKEEEEVVGKGVESSLVATGNVLPNSAGGLSSPRLLVNAVPSNAERVADEEDWVLGMSKIFCSCAEPEGRMLFLGGRMCHRRWVIGPYWPVLAFVTLPLVVGIPTVLGVFVLPQLHIAIVIVYALLAVIVVVALLSTGCRNPGIVSRTENQPEGRDDWIWSDQARSYRPRNSRYCSYCKVIVEDYDHVCPWTGTAIGKNNLKCFYVFAASVNVLCYGSIFVLMYWIIAVKD